MTPSLNELIPQFVKNTGEGYVLTDAGARVIGATVSGVYTDSDADLVEQTMGECPEPTCDGVLEGEYEDGHVTITCQGCSNQTVISAPPIVVEAHDPEARPQLLQRYTTSEVQRIARGFCNLCSGPVRARVSRSAEAAQPQTTEPVTVIHQCQACGNVAHTTAMVCVLDHPAVVSLLHDAGVDYRNVALWRAPTQVDREETLLSVDPVQVEIELTADDESLWILLDAGLDVVEYSHSAESGAPS